MDVTYQIRVDSQGTIVLPEKLREENGIVEGDILNLTVSSENVFILSLRRSQVDEIANKLAQEWEESRESVESMLMTLRDVWVEHETGLFN